MPGRLDAQYVAEDGARKVPVMLHRAVLGSFERFIGILIEHYEGAFPAWLAPRQAVVVNITDKHAAYATEVAERLQAAGFRAETDLETRRSASRFVSLSWPRCPMWWSWVTRRWSQVRSRCAPGMGRTWGRSLKRHCLKPSAAEVARKGRTQI